MLDVQPNSKGTMLQQLCWLQQYRARLAARSIAANMPMTDKQLDNAMNTVPMAEAAEYYETDPIGAADEEIANWED